MRSILGHIGLFLLLLTLLTASFTLNVIVHETGHYIVAERFHAQPTMHFENPLQNGVVGFSIVSATPVAYVAFQPVEDTWETASVALAGVLFNAILGLIFTFIYLQMEKSHTRTTLFLALVLPCILSIFINLNIWQAQSDGALLFHLLGF